MRAEAEIIVGAKIQDLLPVHGDLRILFAGDDAFAFEEAGFFNGGEFLFEVVLEFSVHRRWDKAGEVNRPLSLDPRSDYFRGRSAMYKFISRYPVLTFVFLTLAYQFAVVGVIWALLEP